MALKENLLKKIHIDNMSNKVLASIGPRESGAKLDKETMRSLLETAGCETIRKRDLDLYRVETDKENETILVLDNELPIYRTTADDVALRKSPLIKEMISIRNIIKILNDADVIVSKREESVKTIQKKCIDRLDFSFGKADLEALENEGIGSLEGGDVEGVIETLALFAELLDYRPAPNPFKIKNYKTVGALTKNDKGEIVCGPMVICGTKQGIIKLIDEPVNGLNKDNVEFVHHVAMGKEKAAKEGPSVFTHLKETVLEGRGVVG